jgi:hypothetical protein
MVTVEHYKSVKYVLFVKDMHMAKGLVFDEMLIEHRNMNLLAKISYVVVTLSFLKLVFGVVL